MSSFFSQIEETFRNQTKENDFEKVDNQYKDKTFRFQAEDPEPEYNCFVSKRSKKDGKNFELLEDIFGGKWYKNWKYNNYKSSEFPIEQKDLELSFNILQNYSFLPNITIDDWKTNWNIIISENKDKQSLISPYKTFELDFYDTVIRPKLKEKYSNVPEYLKKIDKHFEVKSISKIDKDFKIFDNNINCTNVEQGCLGTCYFLETISTLSNYGQLLFQLFPNEKLNKEGIYEICLFYKGRWQKVLVDDYFVFYKNTNEFLFCRPINNCLFSCFLEKAYAKLIGSYSDIIAGNLSKAFEALTGFESFIITRNYFNYCLYNYFYNKIKEGYLFSCATADHAYSLISILDENSDKIFQIRNPWNYLDDEKKGDLEKFKEFLNEYPKYKGIREKNSEGIFFLDQKRFETFFEQICICQVLFGSSIYSYNLSNISNNYNENMYIFFEIYKTSKISVGIFDFNRNGFIKNFSVKIKNMNDLKEESLNTISDIKNQIQLQLNDLSSFNFDNYKELKKAKYLLKINLSNLSKLDLQDKILKIVIEGNIDLKYLGSYSYEPDINNTKQKIKFTKYNYGLRTAELFKNYKNIIKVLEEEFNIKMHPDAKGFYLETIFTNEVETIIRFDKEKLKNQICSYDLKENIYFIGTKHINGKIEDDGKAILLVDEKVVTVHSGKIHKNKILCQLIDLDTINDSATLIIPNITIFNDDSYIQSHFHKHKLRYKSAGVRWQCDFCNRIFDSNVDSFGCRECDFDLCMNCLFSKNENNKNNRKMVIKYIFESNKTEIKIFGDSFVKKNKNICKINYNGKDIELKEYLLIKEFAKNKKEFEINITLICHNSEIESLDWMFSFCEDIKYLYLDISNFDTSKVSSMSSMFFGCKKLREIKGINNFNTSKVTDMDSMFYSCEELQYLDLSNFDTSKAFDIEYMFYGCKKLREIKGINNFNTGQTTSMESMFEFCEELNNLDLSNFDTSKVVCMKNMFYYCQKLQTLDLSTFNTSRVTDMSSMFCGCKKLREIKGINNFNTKKVTDMDSMFNCCFELQYLDLSNFNTSKVTNMKLMFFGCNKLREIKGKENFKNIEALNLDISF